MRTEELKAKRKCLFGLAAIIVIAACRGTPHRTNEANEILPDSTQVNNAAANEVKAHDFVEIAFDPGSATLTSSSRSSLNALLTQASASGKIDEILVMSWSDQEIPSVEAKRLTKADRDLATSRNKTIKEYLRTAREGIDVETFNMATQPNPLAKMFNTRDSRLKKSLLAAGLPTTADERQYPSKASHAVILVKIE
jgi:hypothetical protein